MDLASFQHTAGIVLAHNVHSILSHTRHCPGIEQAPGITSPETQQHPLPQALPDTHQLPRHTPDPPGPSGHTSDPPARSCACPTSPTGSTVMAQWGGLMGRILPLNPAWRPCRNGRSPQPCGCPREPCRDGALPGAGCQHLITPCCGSCAAWPRDERPACCPITDPVFPAPSVPLGQEQLGQPHTGSPAQPHRLWGPQPPLVGLQPGPVAGTPSQPYMVRTRSPEPSSGPQPH